MKKVRVENLPAVVASHYEHVVEPGGGAGNPSLRPFTVLLVKPHQASRRKAYGPPLGLLMLAAGLRRYFADRVTVHFWDMSLYHHSPELLAERLDVLRPDVLGVSALNAEAAASYRLAEIAKSWNPSLITVLGGPFALRQSELIFKESRFDWVFEGAADRTFLLALERHFSGAEPGTDLPGFNYRLPEGGQVIDHRQDLIKDMDSLPLPAWDLVDFERYRRRDRPRMITNDAERTYAFIFTSRGCPYLCNYCHDIFTKRFVYRSEDNVLEEMRLLYERYGVREFHFVDDIFNLHKPRVKSLMRRIHELWPTGIHLAFPNGLRGDILDQSTIDAMVLGGTYHAVISIETVTPRLQDMIEKHLDIERAKWSIEAFAQRGVVVHGAFMIGFPTETPAEIEATIAYAINSPITHAHFFTVVPQPETPIYEQALREAPLVTIAASESERFDYSSSSPWYSQAYGYNLERARALAFLRFYLHPPRLLRILRQYPMFVLVRGGFMVLASFLASRLAPPCVQKKVEKVVIVDAFGVKEVD